MEAAKSKLKLEHYNWLLISTWFGLRPREVNNLLSDGIGFFEINPHEEHGFVLHIFQEKLYERGTSREKCWKLIPTYFLRQREVIEIIRSKKFKQPIAKIIKKCFGEHYTAYGGRKNFVDMLRSHGFELEVASRWMGHLSVKTTEKSYSKVDALIYRPPEKLAG